MYVTLSIKCILQRYRNTNAPIDTGTHIGIFIIKNCHNIYIFLCVFISMKESREGTF